MRKCVRTGAAVVVATGVLLSLGGCGSDRSNNGDLKGVLFHRPDKVEGYSNVDGHPNLIRLCIDGVAFMTNSRAQNSVLRVPEWDHWCTGVAK